MRRECIQNYEISNRLEVKYLFLEGKVALKRAVVYAGVGLPSVSLMFWLLPGSRSPVMLVVVVGSSLLVGASRLWLVLSLLFWSSLLQQTGSLQFEGGGLLQEFTYRGCGLVFFYVAGYLLLAGINGCLHVAFQHW